MALLHSRLRRRTTAALLWVMSCLLASVFLTMVQYYFISFLSGLSGYMHIQYGLSLAIAVALYGGLLVLMIDLPKVSNLLAAGVTLLVIAVQVGRMLVVVWSSPEAVALIRFPAILLISAYLFFVGVIFFRAAGAEQDGTIALLLRRLSVLTLLFAPVSTIFYLLSYRFEVLGRLHISLDFFYFTAWSIIAVSVFLRYLTKPTALLDDGKVSPAFVSAYKITPREEEVVKLISFGLSNQEIADRLFVSFTTVRTHVYNIFRKTGVKSRVELLRILSGFRQ